MRNETARASVLSSTLTINEYAPGGSTGVAAASPNVGIIPVHGRSPVGGGHRGAGHPRRDALVIQQDAPRGLASPHARMLVE